MEQIKRVVTSTQMKQIEKNAAESGLSYFQMMDNAGMRATDFIKDNIDKWVFSSTVVIFCGKGNNGGDGLVVARELEEANANVMIVLVDGEPTSEDAIRNYHIVKALGVKIKVLPAEEKEVKDMVSKADVLVDAIYGTGFHGLLRENAKMATSIINNSNAVVYSLDIPSGLDGDNGIADEDAVEAAFTITFDSYKPAHIMKDTAKYCGEVVCVDIGISEACHNFLK